MKSGEETKKETKKESPFFMVRFVKCLGKTTGIIGKVIKILKEQNIELQFDYICGHWLGLDTDCSVTLIKDNANYMVSLFNDGVLSEQFSILPVKEKLWVYAPNKKICGEAYLFFDNQLLTIEGYGTFIRDHILGYTSSDHTQIKEIRATLKAKK